MQISYCCVQGFGRIRRIAKYGITAKAEQSTHFCGRVIMVNVPRSPTSGIASFTNCATSILDREQIIKLVLSYPVVPTPFALQPYLMIKRIFGAFIILTPLPQFRICCVLFPSPCVISFQIAQPSFVVVLEFAFLAMTHQTVFMIRLFVEFCGWLRLATS